MGVAAVAGGDDAATDALLTEEFLDEAREEEELPAVRLLAKSCAAATPWDAATLAA
jgi:hypothetical protein